MMNIQRGKVMRVVYILAVRSPRHQKLFFLGAVVPVSRAVRLLGQKLMGRSLSLIRLSIRAYLPG